MSDITKKLSMKKTFFVTQLESFFASITNEFNQTINDIEVENKLLKQENDKLKYDVENLVKIKENLTKELEEMSFKAKNLEKELVYVKEVNTDEQNLELIRENNKLKKSLEQKDEEIESLKTKIKTLQTIAQKGSNPYNQSIIDKKNEEIVKEITQNLRK